MRNAGVSIHTEGDFTTMGLTTMTTKCLTWIVLSTSGGTSHP